MKIIVCVKQVTLLPGPVVLLDGNQGVDPLFTTQRLNDPDRYALEEALAICEGLGGGEVVAVTVGEKDAEKELRKCLAMGAHRAIRVESAELTHFDPISVGRALASVARQESADLVVCGVQSEDAAQQATGPALASALGHPCVTMAVGLELSSDQGSAVVHREARSGVTEVVEVSLPLVLTVQTGMNTPRTESFKAVMLAKRAPIEVLLPENIPASRVTVQGVSANAPSRGQLQMVAGGAEEIAAKIRELIKEAS